MAFPSGSEERKMATWLDFAIQSEGLRQAN